MISILESYIKSNSHVREDGGGKTDSDKQRQKKTLPLCTVYEEAFEGLVPFLKRANKKGNGSNTEGSEGNYQGEGGVLSNIDSHATG